MKYQVKIQGKLIIHCINSFHIYRLIVFHPFKNCKTIESKKNQTWNIIKASNIFCHVFTIGACARFPFLLPASQSTPTSSSLTSPGIPTPSLTLSNFRSLSLSLRLLVECGVRIVLLANMSFVTYTQFLLLVMPKEMRMKAPCHTWTMDSIQNCHPAFCRTVCRMLKRLRQPLRHRRKKWKRMKRRRVSCGRSNNLQFCHISAIIRKSLPN